MRSESNVCVVCERVCEEEGEQTWNAFEETRARSCKGGGGDGSVRDLIGRLEIAEVSLGERAYPSVEHSGRWWWPSYDMFTVAIIVVRVGDERRGFGKQELGCQASQ